MRLVNLVLSAVTAWLVYVIALSIWQKRPVALLALVLYLIHPGLLIAEARGGFECLFILLLMVFVLVLCRILENGQVRDFVLAGVLLGLTTLVRSTLILFPIFMFAYMVVVTKKQQRIRWAATRAGAMALAMAVVVSPWAIRNHFLVDKFIPTGSVAGISAQAGQYICKNISFERGFYELDLEASTERNRLAAALEYKFKASYYQYFYSPRDELDFSSYLLSRVWQEYENSPSLWFKCAAMNLYNFWFTGKSWGVTVTNMAVQLPYLVFAVLGACSGVRRKQPTQITPLLLLIFYLFLLHVAIFAQARYSIPLVPVLSILAGMGIWRFAAGTHADRDVPHGAVGHSS